jgi:rod shape-determining protein MreD
MAEILFYPILILLLIIQTAILRHIPFLGGSADLLLLWLVAWGLHPSGKHAWIGAIFAGLLMGYVSAVPWYASMISYLIVIIASRFLSKRFWQNPLIALFFITFFCAIIQNVLVYLSLYVGGAALNWSSALRNVIIPTVFLDMLLTLPVYAIVNDMARWVYPLEVEA